MSALGGTIAQSVVPTPHRHTRAEFDGAQWVNRQGSWGLHRDATQIARESVQLPDGTETERVLLLAGCGWLLEPALLSQSGQLTPEGAAGMLDGNEEADLAPNIKSEYRYQKPVLPGVTVSGDVPDVALPCYVKEVTSGQDYGRDDLQSDRLAFPGPANAGNVPFDRLLAGVKTYRAGQPFLFSFFVPTVGEPGDVLYRFFFGGPSDTTTRTFGTGEWCVSFKGDGSAELHERVFGWTRRHQFRWADSTAAAKGWAHCFICPFDRSRIFFIASSGKGNDNAQRRIGEERVSPRDYALNTSLYYHSPLLAKYVYKESITGAGHVRVDARGDLAARFAVGASKYHDGGTLVDAPFAFPQVLPAGSVFRVKPQQIVPTDTSLDTYVIDPDTGTQLDTGTNPYEWLTVAGQKRYQVKFIFQGTDTTPYLRSYDVELDATVTEALVDEAPTVSVNVGPLAVNLMGPDQDVTHQSGSLVFHDREGECTPLQTRGRVPFRLYTEYAADHSETCLFDGELSAEAETVYLTNGSSYERYECTLTGKWATVWEQLAEGPLSYGWDTDANQPKTVTQTIYDLFRLAGVPDEQLDIPEQSLPFWLSADEPNRYRLQPGVRFLDVIQRLAREYLDAWVTWCPNSGTSGLWRLRLNPTNPSSNIVWNFVTTAPTVLGDDALPTAALVHVPGAYELNTIYATRVRTKRQAPEINSLRVYGIAPGPVVGTVDATKYNPKSFTRDPENPTADPTSPDYIGREIHEAFFAYTVSQEECNFLCARFYDLLCHGRVLKIIDAPFFTVVDTEDDHYRVPRPLQIGDCITLDGSVGVVQTCHVSYNDDVNQSQCLEVVMVPEGT